MTDLGICDQSQSLPALNEARSLFWTIRQLTRRSAVEAGCGRSYLFELHQLASKGLDITEELIERSEGSGREGANSL